MFATKLLLQLSNKPCLNLLVRTELWNWNKDDYRLLVLDVNFLTNAHMRTLLLTIRHIANMINYSKTYQSLEVLL